MLAAFAERPGIEVLVASTDGRPLIPFDGFIDSQNHPLAAQITSLPTTLIYSSGVDGVVYGFEGYRNPRWYLAQLNRGVSEALSVAHG